MNLSSCGIDCDACKFAADQNCPGCYALKGNPHWGECDLYVCAVRKGVPHCGKCDEFPCDMLKEWSSAENGERIDNLKALG